MAYPAMQGSSGQDSYSDFISEAEKPSSERKKIVGRGGKEQLLRKYHLKDVQKSKLTAAAHGGTINPLGNRVGAYWGAVQALIQLGVNVYHPHLDVRTEMYKIMSAIPKKKKQNGKIIETNAWNDFFNKAPRSTASMPKDGDGKITQNFKVLQRLPHKDKKELHPYGFKLAQFGMSIDIEYRDLGTSSTPCFLPFYKLNIEHEPDPTGLTITPVYNNPNKGKGRGRKKKVTSPPASPPVKVIEDVKEAEKIITKSLIIGDALNDFANQIAEFEGDSRK